MTINKIFDRVYKFRELSEDNFDALKNKYLWFAEPEHFEDKNEGEFLFHNITSNSELINYAKKILIEEGCKPAVAERLILRNIFFKDFYAFMRKSINGLHSRFSTYSKSLSHLSTVGRLANTPDVNIVANDFMWRKYGGNLSGFCLEFDSEKLVQSLKENHPEHKILYGKINYTDDIPVRALSDNIDNLLESYVRHYFRKQELYLEEFECRFTSSDLGKHFFSPCSLKSVYLGSEMNLSNRNKLETIIAEIYPNASIYILARGQTLFHQFKHKDNPE